MRLPALSLEGCQCRGLCRVAPAAVGTGDATSLPPPFVPVSPSLSSKGFIRLGVFQRIPSVTEARVLGLFSISECHSLQISLGFAPTERVQKCYWFIFWHCWSEGGVPFCASPSSRPAVTGQVRLWAGFYIYFLCIAEIEMAVYFIHANTLVASFGVSPLEPCLGSSPACAVPARLPPLGTPSAPRGPLLRGRERL